MPEDPGLAKTYRVFINTLFVAKEMVLQEQNQTVDITH